ncbi:hypothetical protein [Nonomuraea sp. CA-141351]|uniref:hypothetical protein n=1 Tax=Nonomuraea sp. CA-141351 TaxID=3239996 RepID=UPI003D90A23E
MGRGGRSVRRTLGPEEDVPGRTGRRQRFDRGEIAWSPDQDMVTSVFNLRTGALWSMAWVHKDTGDTATAAQWAVK